MSQSTKKIFLFFLAWVMAIDTHNPPQTLIMLIVVYIFNSKNIEI